MNTTDWKKQFSEVFEHGVASWKNGNKTPATMFTVEESTFLRSIGYTTQELFDFVDDSQRYGEPDLATALEVAEIRRDYFLNIMKGKYSDKVGSVSALPAKTATVEGIQWLPRIIEKARLKLQGEMPPELMYGCAGDRDFLSRVKMTMPQFLKLVRDAGNDNKQIVDAVKRVMIS